MNKTLRYVLVGAAAIVALVLVVPFAVPTGVYGDRIEAAATRATGRALHIEGPLRLMLFPQFGLTAENVSFANMPGGHAASMARADDIKLAVRFLPLLSGHLELERIVLDHPVIELEVNAEGRANWHFVKSQTAHGGSVTLPVSTEFSGIQINDGRISYTNDKTGTHRELDHVDAAVAITRPDQPLAVDGHLTQNGHKVDFDAKIATLKSLIGEGTTGLDLSLTSDVMQAGFKGGLGHDGAMAGTLKFDTASLRGVIGWLGGKLPASGGFGRTSLESHVASKDKLTTFSGMRLVLDQSNMTGTLAIDNSGIVTSLTGVLSLDRLDLNPYLTVPERGPARHNSETGWSRKPINLALLKTADAKLRLEVGALRLRNLRLGRSVLNVSLAGGALVARLDPVALYGGSGQVALEVDTRGAVPSYRSRLKFGRVSLQPFLRDTLGVDRIQGAGTLALDVAAQGTSPDAVMHTLAGQGSLAADHGRIRGVDLGAVARTIQTLFGGTTDNSAGTDYLAMDGSFVIAKGVLTNKDLAVAGPVLSMTGAGEVDIGNRVIDFRLVPMARAKGVSVGIPFRVNGPWDHVHYKPELSGIVGGVIQNLESGKAPFKGLFGSGQKKQDQGGQPNDQPKKKKKSAGDILKNMFGIH